MVSAWPEPPSAMSAEKSAGVRDGMQALAFGGTETPPNRAEEQSGVQAALNLPADFCGERNSGEAAPLRDPPQFARLVVGCLPSSRKHYIVLGRRAALENELRLSSRFVVDGAEIVAGKRHNKLSLPHDTPNFRSPPIHLQ
jgi:hypothetical protein